MPPVIAWECGNDVFLLDDGSRYLFWYAICEKLARIVYPTQIGKIMKIFIFSGEMKLECIEDSLVGGMDCELGKQLTVIRWS